MPTTGMFLEFADCGSSKAWLMNLSKSLARTQARQGIIPVCVAPGDVEADTVADDLRRFGDPIEAEFPLRLVAQPDDVAKTILFPASPPSHYLAGATIDAHGG